MTLQRRSNIVKTEAGLPRPFCIPSHAGTQKHFHASGEVAARLAATGLRCARWTNSTRQNGS